MQCKIKGHPIEDIHWKFNGNFLEKDSRVFQVSEEVYSNNIMLEEKMRECINVSLQTDGTVVQAAAQVLLGDVAPQFISTFTGKKMQPGPSISLKCVSTGRPDPEITWIQNGKKLKKRITVYGLPYIHDIDNVTVAAGQNATLNCYVSGHPIKFMQVEKSGKDYQNGSLFIADVKDEEDEGWYTCSASNGKGQVDKKSTYLNVMNKPSIMKGLKKQEIKYGSPLSTICSVLSGDEPVSISWLKDGNEIKLRKGTDVSTTKMYSVLQIRKVQKEHTGNYTCVAENKVGKDIKTVSLTILYSPEWIKEPSNKYAELGSTIHFHCLANGSPVPKYKWWRFTGEDFKVLKSEGLNHKILQNGTLEIKNIETSDATKYMCRAANGVNPKLRKEVLLQIAGNEDKVENIPSQSTIHPEIEEENMSKMTVSNAVHIFGTDMFTESHLVNQMDASSPIKDNKHDKEESRTYDSDIRNSESKIRQTSGFMDEFMNMNVVIYGIPAFIVIFLLIAVIIALAMYLVLKKKNSKTKRELLRLSEMNIKENYYKDKSMSVNNTLNRRYGKLDKHETMSNQGSHTIRTSGYEIPDYYAEMKPYDTLQLSSRHQSQLNEDHRDSQCTVDPQPEVQWYKVDEYIQQEREKVTEIQSLISLFRNGSLGLMPFDSDEYRPEIHANVYTCEASNKHGRIVSPTMSVRAFTKQQQQQLQAQVYDEYVITGNTAVLKCHIPAFFKEDLEVISWIREDNTVLKPNKYEKGYTITENGNLYIERVTDLHSKVGYWCQVKNKITGDTFLSKTAGRIKLTEPQENLNVYIRPDFQVVNSNENVKMTCSVTGYPIDKVKWKFNGRNLDESDRFKELSKYSMEIISIKREDEGMYQCFVSNKWQVVQAAAQLILGDLGPEFVKTFTTKRLQPGPSISLQCSAVGRPLPSIRWKLNGYEIEKNKKFTTVEIDLKNETATSKLIVKNIRIEDGGEYSCLAKNRVNEKTFSEKIIVYGLPIVHTIQNVTVAAGQDVFLQCFVSGYPIKEIAWKRGVNHEFLPSNSVDFGNGTLFLKNVRNKKDEGSYICSASNGRGTTDMKSTELTILVKPSLQPPSLKKLTLESDSPFSTLCSVIAGDEPMTIRWLKDGNDIILGKGTDISTTKLFSVLQTRNVDKTHSGNYTCVAENRVGKDMKNVSLTVNYPPEWVKEPSSRRVNDGDSASFDCVAKGLPHPTYKWWKIVGERLELFAENMNLAVLQNGTLILNKAKPEDTSTYVCIVSNGVSPDLVKKIFIKIGGLPRIVYLNESVIAKPGEDIIITCKVTTVTLMNIRWIKENKRIKTDEPDVENTNGQAKTVSSTLKLNDLNTEDAGQYTCIAQNENGKVEKSSAVIISEFGPSKINPEKKSGSILDYYLDTNVMIYVIPAIVVVVLLIAVIITLVVYLILKYKNAKSRPTGITNSEDLSSKDIIEYHERNSAQSLDRRYGRLGQDSLNYKYDANTLRHSGEYEIPDYYAGMKPYATLQLSTRHQPNSDKLHRDSQASV
ncbi:Down syndrome cell adhesion molecule-like protein Dscam2 [Nymphon striatum]|nr:Down syndrome cell adhesion molecule-like protein Dscam2 [Nymphon striatum]